MKGKNMKRIIIAMLFLVGLTVETTLKADLEAIITKVHDQVTWQESHPARNYPVGTKVTFTFKDSGQKVVMVRGSMYGFEPIWRYE